MRILLAEDEKSLSNALVSIFKHNNYSIDAVYNGIEAIEKAKNGVYDVIVLDVMMPLLDGISALKEIRKLNITTPVLMLTAKTEIEDKILGLDSGADDYLTKPFVVPELLARVRALSRRGNYQPDNTLTFGDLVLDRTTYQLSCNNQIVNLKNKEFQVLELLMLQPKSVISTERFIEKVWGYDCESEINVVWTHISFLRRKLSSLNSNVQIKASRNIGYTLELVND